MPELGPYKSVVFVDFVFSGLYGGAVFKKDDFGGVFVSLFFLKRAEMSGSENKPSSIPGLRGLFDYFIPSPFLQEFRLLRKVAFFKDVIK